jgi:FMN reductase
VQLVVLVGNPKPQSRTLDVAEMLAERVSRLTGASHEQTVDLCDYSDEIFRWPDETLTAISADVAAAGIVIVASPTYKASYTGLLKAFLDRYPSRALAGVTAIPLMTMANPAHSLSVDFTLRPLLVELGASVPTKGMSFLTSDVAEAPAFVDAWVSSQEHLLKSRLNGIPEHNG